MILLTLKAMRRPALAIGLLSLFVAGTQNHALEPPMAAARISFPFQTGVQWVYSGNAKRSHAETGNRLTSTDWKTEVVEVLKREYVLAARIRGCPLGLLTSAAPSAECAVVQVGSRLLYVVEPVRASEVLARLRNSADELVGLLHESELVIDFPLSVGQRIGETAQLTRQCTAAPKAADSCPFSWNVIAARPAHAGLSIPAPPAGLLEYELRWQGQSGYKTLRFTNGIGFTGFDFNHGPSAIAAEMTLAAYQQ